MKIKSFVAVVAIFAFVVEVQAYVPPPPTEVALYLLTEIEERPSNDIVEPWLWQMTCALIDKDANRIVENVDLVVKLNETFTKGFTSFYKTLKKCILYLNDDINHEYPEIRGDTYYFNFIGSDDLFQNYLKNTLAEYYREIEAKKYVEKQILQKEMCEKYDCSKGIIIS